MKEQKDKESFFNNYPPKEIGLLLMACVLGWVGLAKLIGGSGIEVADQSSNSFWSKEKKFESTDLTSKMNVKLKEVELKRQAAEIEAKLHTLKSGKKLKNNEIDPYNLIPEPHIEPGIDLQEENPSADIAKSLEERPSLEMTPMSEIDLKVANDRWLLQYDKQYTKAFVREVIDRAYEDGFIIEFTEDLKLKSVRRRPAATPGF